MADESGKMIKKQVNIPVIVVGGIRKLSEMKQMIENQWVDMISLSRPLIIEPSFVRKMQEGKSEESKCRVQLLPHRLFVYAFEMLLWENPSSLRGRRKKEGKFIYSNQIC